MRAPASGITLTEDDAAVVKGMLARGDRQHDIAAWFGVNGGRIAEISTGHRFPGVAPQEDDLPPPGPYTTAKAVNEAKEKLAEMRATLASMIEEIDEQIEKLATETQE